MSFQDELRVWGPAAPRVPGLSESLKYCRALARSHYENFTVVSWLLPRRLHQDFYNIYAYCRWSDDLADEVLDPRQSLDLLAWWRQELARCFGEAPRHPVMVALRETVRRFGIPITPLEDLIAAFEQDQRLTHYETYDQLLEYCRYSANPVGRLVLYLGECFDPQRAAWSDRICTALQLANHWQDIARDHARGRVYLPRQDRDRFGYSDSDLEARRWTPQFRDLMAFEVGRARALFVEGLPLVEAVPGRLRIDIELFARGGLAVLDRIESIDYDVWSQRPTLSRAHQLRLFGGALMRSLFRQRAVPAPVRPDPSDRCSPSDPLRTPSLP